MPMIDDLEPLLAAPAEALDVEFKGWLDLRGNDEHKGALAKAAIALANEGGGVIVIGFRENRPNLVSESRPAGIAGYDADLINSIIRRFASPSFHCTLTFLLNRQNRTRTRRNPGPWRLQRPGHVEERYGVRHNPTAHLLRPQARS
jgi:predicted HTH transcriptional regulator